MTKSEAQAIYIEIVKPEKIDLDVIVKLIQDNWWWISLVGKKLFKFILKLWHNRKKKKNERQTSTKNSNS